MSRIDERLEVMGVNTSGMSDEVKFTTATGLTHYNAEMAENDWYVPGGAANVKKESNSTDEDNQNTSKYYTAETAATYNAALDGAVHEGDVKEEAVEEVPAVYSFNSFGTESNVAYGTGKVKVISQENNKTTVEVIENNPNDPNAENFVGQTFVVNATELGEESYELFTTNGDATGISVSIALESEAIPAKNEVLWTKEDADEYNATLDGAVKEGDEIKSEISIYSGD